MLGRKKIYKKHRITTIKDFDDEMKKKPVNDDRGNILRGLSGIVDKLREKGINYFHQFSDILKSFGMNRKGIGHFIMLLMNYIQQNDKTIIMVSNRICNKSNFDEKNIIFTYIASYYEENTLKFIGQFNQSVQNKFNEEIDQLKLQYQHNLNIQNNNNPQDQNDAITDIITQRNQNDDTNEIMSPQIQFDTLNDIMDITNLNDGTNDIITPRDQNDDTNEIMSPQIQFDTLDDTMDIEDLNNDTNDIITPRDQNDDTNEIITPRNQNDDTNEIMSPQIQFDTLDDIVDIEDLSDDTNDIMNSPIQFDTLDEINCLNQDDYNDQNNYFYF